MNKESTYSILSKLIKQKFYPQIKDSGIVLEDIYIVKNLVTGKEYYMLIINDFQIKFVTTRDFVIHFVNYLNNSIKKLDEEFEYLVSRPKDRYTDDVGIEMKYKELDHYRFKQRELRNLFTEIKEKLK